MDALQSLPLAELHARANQLADRCRQAAAAGDSGADGAAFEQLLSLLREIERRSPEPAEPTLVTIDPHLR